MQVCFLSASHHETRALYAGRSGEPLLLVHGYGSTADLWVRMIDRLAAERQVLAPDLIGHGFSEWRDLPGPILPRLAEHLVAVMAEFGHRRFAVAGSSLGGMIAAWLAIHRPDVLTSVAIIGSDASFAEKGLLDPAIIASARQNGMSALAHPTLEACRQRLLRICFDPATPVEDIALVQATAYGRADRMQAYDRIGQLILEGIKDGSAAVPAERITVPTLVVCGRNDPRADIMRIRTGMGRLRDGRLVEIERCGHLPHLEQPGILADSLCAHLDRAAPAKLAEWAR